MRIIGGVAGGRRLAVPPSGTRPTTDRVREALFSSLDAFLGGWEGVRVLDLYAGSGAIGLEALSRGATSAMFVERDRRTADLLRRNIEAVGLPGAEVLVADATALNLVGSFDVIYLDPPYDVPDETVTSLLTHLVEGQLLAPGGLVIVERSSRSGAPWPHKGWREVRRRAYGETALWYGQSAS